MTTLKQNIFDIVVIFLEKVNFFFYNIGSFLNMYFFQIDTYGIDLINLSYGATAVSESILKVYNTILFIELLMLIALIWIILCTIFYFKDTSVDNKLYWRFNVHYTLYKNVTFFTSKIVELLWTLLPFGILFFIGYPSLALLYLVEERIHPEVIIKVIGHQWYWSYEDDSGNHCNIISLTNNLFTIDEFYELVRFITKSGLVSMNYPYDLEKWINSLYGIKKELTEYDLNHLLGIYCLMGNISKVPILTPFVDKTSINELVLFANNFYNYIIDFSNVMNSNEFFSMNILQSITEQEMLALSNINIYTNEARDFYQPYFWVERAFNLFDYKYLWLDIDAFGDILRYTSLENLLSFDRFDCIFLDGLIFDSYLLKDYDLLYIGEKRLLEVDNRLILPSRTHIQLVITSTDVIHSFSIPSFGIKIDAIPGRLNQCFIFSKFDGTFFGQCSELCGVDHGYMPIVVEMVSYAYYFTSVKGYFGYYDDIYYSSGWETLLSR